MKHVWIALSGLLAWASLPGFCLAQTMERYVVGAAGGSVQTAAGSLDFTVGEMLIAPRTAGNLYWGEGFQQAWIAPVVSTADAETAPPLLLTVYPNPAVQHLFVESNRPLLQAQLFDLTGRPVSDRLPINGATRFDLGRLPAGLYLLRALDENGRLAGVAKVQRTR